MSKITQPPKEWQSKLDPYFLENATEFEKMVLNGINILEQKIDYGIEIAEGNNENNIELESKLAGKITELDTKISEFKSQVDAANTNRDKGNKELNEVRDKQILKVENRLARLEKLETIIRSKWSFAAFGVSVILTLLAAAASIKSFFFGK